MRPGGPDWGPEPTVSGCAGCAPASRP